MLVLTLSEGIENIAKIAHELNRTYCAAIGDTSQPCWDVAPDWQKQSAIAGVLFHLGNPNASASDSHDSWLAVKEADGWIYGPVKDADKKEHPCIVPYNKLPLEQQVKDHLFKFIVHAIGNHKFT
jgi:hypothetical protein